MPSPEENKQQRHKIFLGVVVGAMFLLASATLLEPGMVRENLGLMGVVAGYTSLAAFAVVWIPWVIGLGQR